MIFGILTVKDTLSLCICALLSRPACYRLKISNHTLELILSKHQQGRRKKKTTQATDVAACIQKQLQTCLAITQLSIDAPEMFT